MEPQQTQRDLELEHEKRRENELRKESQQARKDGLKEKEDIPEPAKLFFEMSVMLLIAGIVLGAIAYFIWLRSQT